MRCTERANAALPVSAPAGRPARTLPLRRAIVFTSALGLAGCAVRWPGLELPPLRRPSEPASPAATAPVPMPAGTAPAPGAPPAPSRTWAEFQLGAARRLVAMHPQGTYLGPVPEILFAIPVIETELNADGTIRTMHALRRPSNPMAADTVQMAMDAIRRAAPYGDVSRLPRPWKWVETFLFDDERRFKPRTLD